MARCPQCNKALAELVRRCPSCMADLDLLVEYVRHLQTGLDQADKLTRAGELGQAMWAYLAVLEVDPDNATARRQVGQVVTAVRQFDHAAPGRRWLGQVRQGASEEGSAAGWLWAAVVIGLVLAAFALGVSVGIRSGSEAAPGPREPAKKVAPQPTDTLRGPS